MSSIGSSRSSEGELDASPQTHEPVPEPTAQEATSAIPQVRVETSGEINYDYTAASTLIYP